MKSTALLACLGLVFVTFGGVAHADHHENAATPTISADASVILPLGDFADFSSLGFGASGTFNFPLNANLTATGRAGLIFHLTEIDDTSLLVIPLLGGAKYNIGTSGVYAAGELGLFYGRVSSGDVSDSNTDIGITAGAGYDLGVADVRAGIQVYDLGELDSSLSLFATASFKVLAL